MPLHELGDVEEKLVVSHQEPPLQVCPEIASVLQICIFVRSPASGSFQFTVNAIWAFAFMGSGESLTEDMEGALLSITVQVWEAGLGSSLPARSVAFT